MKTVSYLFLWMKEWPWKDLLYGFDFFINWLATANWILGLCLSQWYINHNFQNSNNGFYSSLNSFPFRVFFSLSLLVMGIIFSLASLVQYSFFRNRSSNNFMVLKMNNKNKCYGLSTTSVLYSWSIFLPAISWYVSGPFQLISSLPTFLFFSKMNYSIVPN